MQDNTVLRLPTELCRLRDTDRLVKEWAEIQRDLRGEQKIMAMFRWRSQMLEHVEAFHDGLNLT